MGMMEQDYLFLLRFLCLLRYTTGEGSIATLLVRRVREAIEAIGTDIRRGLADIILHVDAGRYIGRSVEKIYRVECLGAMRACGECAADTQ